MNNLNERVARFIARYRTVVAKSSVWATNDAMAYFRLLGSRLFDDEIASCEDALQNSGIVEAIENEEARYQEIVAQNVSAQLLAIQGVKEIILGGHGDSTLQIVIQAYYHYKDAFYDAGKWIFVVNMLDMVDNAFNAHFHLYNAYALDDGTCFINNEIFYGRLCDMFEGTLHPLYGNIGIGFCFGNMYGDIVNYLLTGDFVSAFQLVSLCLHHVNFRDMYRIPQIFNIAYDVDTRELSEYFGLSDKDMEAIETRYREMGEEEL